MCYVVHKWFCGALVVCCAWDFLVYGSLFVWSVAVKCQNKASSNSFLGGCVVIEGGCAVRGVFV